MNSHKIKSPGHYFWNKSREKDRKHSKRKDKYIIHSSDEDKIKTEELKIDNKNNKEIDIDIDIENQ